MDARFFGGHVPDILDGGAASVWLGAFCWKYPLTDISSTENIKQKLQWGAINQFYTGMVNEMPLVLCVRVVLLEDVLLCRAANQHNDACCVLHIRSLPGWKEELSCWSEEVLGGKTWRWKSWSRMVSVIFRSWGSTLDESCVRKSTPPTSLNIWAPVGCFSVQEKRHKSKGRLSICHIRIYTHQCIRIFKLLFQIYNNIYSNVITLWNFLVDVCFLDLFCSTCYRRATRGKCTERWDINENRQIGILQPARCSAKLCCPIETCYSAVAC